MTRQSALHFHPERIAWIGAGVLGFVFFLVFPFIWQMYATSSPVDYHRQVKEVKEAVSSSQFAFKLNDCSPGFSLPDLRSEMTFSFDPPRPDGGNIDVKRLLVRMIRGGDSKRVVLPCRLDLEFQGDRLTFADSPSLFWIELSINQNGEIAADVKISGLDGRTIDAGTFAVSGQECPIQSAHEFSEGSYFRLLADAKWWGKDQFRGSNVSGERLELGSELIEIRGGDWLVWRGKWEKSEKPEKDMPIARIQSSGLKALVLDAWDSESYTRIALNSSTGPPMKIKGEDLFSSIRIRSERQISCMLEKQCMILKTGDWILKSEGRWRILRKKDERDAFLNGKLFGELFILDQISQKQGQKMVQGRLFNSVRTQVVPIEMFANTARKVGEKGAGRGKLQ